jgi:hypothetical protein
VKFRRLFAALALVAAVLFGTAACDNRERPCLKGHYDYVMMTVGKTPTLVPVWDCDVYGKATPNV